MISDLLQDKRQKEKDKRKNKDIFTIPNLFSFYRLVVSPLIMYFIIARKESLYAVFLVINLLTDVVDGFIARRYKMQTEFGARLDSIGDNMTYMLAIIGLLVFKMEDFKPHLFSFLTYINFLLLTIILSLIKFGNLPSFHLYITKINGYIQGVFFICLFTIGFIPILYYLFVSVGILGAIEHVIIQLLIPEMRSNVKGLYWVLKERKTDIKE